MWVGRLVAGATLAFGIAIVGCQPGGTPEASVGPGASAWKDDGTVDCKADNECATGETCVEGICQMKRCGEPNYKSSAPLGFVGYFKRDREIVVSESQGIPGATLAEFDSRNGTLAKAPTPWAQATGKVIDIAGGNFTGKRPESVAIAMDGSSNVTVKAKEGEILVPVGFVPVALSSGDVDGDGLDEIIALADNGTVAACKATTKQCTKITASVPVRATDIAAGDLDGDGYAEAVVLAGTSLAIVNFDSDKTGHKKTKTVTAPMTLLRIAMGDLDGDGHDDLVGLEDSYGEEEVHILSIGETDASARTTVNVASGARDITVGATGADRTTLAVLGGDNTVEMFNWTDNKLQRQSKSVLEGTKNAMRIALSDVDGDSPTRSVKGEPKLVPGRVVPIAVLTLPPYSRTYSEGVSSATLGATEEQEKSDIKTVILGASVGIALGGELGPIVTAEVSATVSRESWSIDTNTKGIAIGGSFELEARPEKDGFSGGAVMLGCACYHQYQYVVDDPKGLLGAGVDGKTIDVFVPVGGQTSVWSTRRYNALAEALKTLPKINVPHKTGQVDSYPTTPKTLDGAPIPEDDLVFKKPPTFRTSDVASVDFELTASESTAKEKHVYDGLTIGAEIGAFGVTLSGEVDMQVGRGYSVSVGREASFAGHVPPVRNDPETPEDEFGLYGYSFTPLVYRHRYTDEDKKGSAFYVLTYAVGQ